MIDFDPVVVSEFDAMKEAEAEDPSPMPEFPRGHFWKNPSRRRCLPWLGMRMTSVVQVGPIHAPPGRKGYCDDQVQPLCCSEGGSAQEQGVNKA